MNHNVQQARAILQLHSNKARVDNPMFFKMGPGEYAEHDKFIGVPVPIVRKVAKQYVSLPLDELSLFLHSAYNEERLLGLFIVVMQYQKADQAQKTVLCQFYMDNISSVNNWNLVDSSAHYIMGDYLYNQDKALLQEYAHSSCLWKRRIAIIATWDFIRRGDYTWTFCIAEILMKDTHDLIHKAVGWMLREVGKKDELLLCAFLDKHATYMPRTMLRYALEKFSIEQRKHYLKK